MAQLQAIVDQLLTNVSSMYQPQGMVAEQVLPLVTSAQSTGKLGKYGSSHLRLDVSTVGGRGGFRRVEAIARSTTSYQIEDHGLEGLVTQSDYRNNQLPFKAEEDETLGLTTILMLQKEQVLAAALTNTSNLTQNVTLSGTAQYNDYANSTPVQDFETARATIMNGCGMAPNIAIMDWQVWNKLRFHSAVLDTLGFKYNRTGGMTNEELAMAMGVEKVFVAQGRYNSAKEGQADSLAPVWGKHIVFAVAPDKAAPYQVSLGYMMGYENQQPRKVYKYPVNNPPESTGIIVQDSYQFLLSNVAAGYLIANAIA